MTRRSSIILSFLLATLLAVGAVEWFYGTLEKSLTGDKTAVQTETDETLPATAAEPGGGVTPAASQKTPAHQGKEDYTIIARRSLFGKVKGKTTRPPLVQKPTPAPAPTSLDLILLGTISGAGNEQRAIIQDKKKGKQDIYYKGDAIEHALIKEILRGKIILEVNGEEEVLLMQESKSPQESADRQKNSRPTTYTLADALEEEARAQESSAKRQPPKRRILPTKKNTLKLE